MPRPKRTKVAPAISTSTATGAGAAKRGRGRPRKNHTSGNQDVEAAESRPNGNESGDEGENGEHGPKRARRSGRFASGATVESGGIGNTNVARSARLLGDQQRRRDGAVLRLEARNDVSATGESREGKEQEQGKKRGRGRPSRARVENANTSLMSSGSEVEIGRRDSGVQRLEELNDASGLTGEHEMGSQEQNQPTKRGRGRPPRVENISAMRIGSEVEIGRREREPSRESILPSIEGTGTANTSAMTGTFKPRARQPSILGVGRFAPRGSSVESLSEMAGTGMEMVMDVLASSFKPRARQPSILGVGRFAPRSSSVGLESAMNTPGVPRSAVKAGLFQRRARKVVAGERGGRTRSEDGDGQGIGQDEDQDQDENNIEDFNPDDESTPLHLARSKSITNTSGTSSVLNPRKRKLASSIHLPSSPPQATHNSEREASSSLPSLSSPPPEPRAETPEPLILSETFAPPQSSSSMHSSPLPLRQPAIQTTTPAVRRGRPRTAPPPPDDDLPSSPPSLTHSPNYRTISAAPLRKAPKEKPAPSSYSTAQLQALLPRRRRRARRDRDEFDIESSEGEYDVSGLGEDDDELSHLTAATGRTNRRTPAPSATATASASMRRVTKLRAKSKTPAPVPVAGEKDKGMGKGKGKRVYGSTARVGATDKENEDISQDEEAAGGEAEAGEGGEFNDSLAPLPDGYHTTMLSSEDSGELERRVGTELKQAKRKFERVDEWVMEFEDVTGSSEACEGR